MSLQVKRMCGGGVRWGTKKNGRYGRLWNFWETRKVKGALVFDWFGVALAWGEDWR